MRIDHLAIWVKDLEASRSFYMKYFGLKHNEKYQSATHPFSSYFLTFENESETRIELMQMPDMAENSNPERGKVYGFAHIAISVGNREEVERLTDRIRSDGYKIVGEPRVTGDGCYESIVEDNEGNWIEITD